MFLDAFAAGPDPSTMSCPAILKGYTTNSGLMQSRTKGEHRAAAAARVQELEPYFQSCGGWAAVSAAGPKSTPALPAPGGGGGGGGMTPDTFGPGGSGGGGRPKKMGEDDFVSPGVDWQKIAMIAGGGVALLLVLGLLLKRRGKGRASASSIVKSASDPVSV